MTSWALIGHRGVGKSQLLNQLAGEFPERRCLSLDAEIEKREKRSIKTIFETEGESGFRTIEEKTLQTCLKEYQGQSLVIDIGAGFRGVIPRSLKCLWVRRKGLTPHSMFLDRPPLDGQLKMKASRFAERTKRYQKRADLQLELREGPNNFQQGERIFFQALLEGQSTSALSSYFFTLNESTTSEERKVLRRLGVAGFEWRDDLMKAGPQTDDRILYSLRKNKDNLKKVDGPWDWPLEWGPNSKASIVSCHTLKGDLQETIQSLPSTDQIIKLAVPVKDFSELITGHRWMQEAPDKRVFLPHSKKGRWSWYRQWTANSTALQFARLAQGSAADQPSVLEVLNQKSEALHFAAVLGSPVSHSWTPTYHQTFFQKQKVSVFAIDVTEAEWDQALPVLEELGLRWAAVTSPLKQKAGATIGIDSPINTLCLTPSGWVGTNTDADGFASLIKNLKGQKVAVWGGGGTLNSVLQSIPEATFYSSRTGEIKEGLGVKAPQVLVWAVGAAHFSRQGVFPPSQWPLKKVIDLNYSNDSPGIECAFKFGCQYQSGAVMFVAQAQKQQEFWNECRIK